MRYWMPLFAVLSLAGCKTSGELAMERDEQKCRAYGLTKGTPDYAQCMVSLEVANRNAAATAQVGQAINNRTLFQPPPPFLF